MTPSIRPYGGHPVHVILCPQCKSEIKIARPTSYVVNGVRALDRALGRMVLPGLGLSLFGTLCAGLSVHGVYAVWTVFGPEQAKDIFEASWRHRSWLIGYPLIPLSLIFSRTNYADFVLPAGTVFLLATQLSEGFEIDMTMWPPLPSTVFACLPAVRTGYNALYEKAFGKLNRKWMAEVQPRQNERAEGEENNAADAETAEEEAMDQAAGGGGIVLELQVNIGANPDEHEAPMATPAHGNEEGAPDGTNDNAAAAPAEAGGAANDNQGGVHQILGPRQDEIVEGTSGIGQTVLGALAFPTISAGVGGLLSFALPAEWMSGSNSMNGRAGLLRHRWGRAVVGGCLFVVLKDALVLYCWWRRAQGHRQRKIMDYDKTTKRYQLHP